MNRTIPQTDPRADLIECRAEIDAAFRAVLERGRYILGEEVRSFEQEFAAYLGVPHAVGVASGTDALTLALRACGIGAGDEVITVSHTAVATVAGIEHSGATPVLVDVEPDTFTLDPARLAAARTPRTCAIVPVHLYGQMADMGMILAFAREHGLKVIEDCAQAHGGAWRADAQAPWLKAGALGDAAAFSFYPTKNLGAIGDGGCVVTRVEATAHRVRELREYGWRERFRSESRGWNSRLDELQAAVLRVKLRRLEEWNARRITVAAAYDQRLTGSGARLPKRRPDCTHVFHQYVVRVRERDRVQAAMGAAGIGVAIHYPIPIHQQPAYRDLACGAELPVTEVLSGEILSLPMHPHLGMNAAEVVAAVLLKSL